MLKTLTRMAIAATLFAGGMTSAIAAAPAQISSSAKGKILVDDSGMTLYTFAKDSKGKSACNGTCAENWPALSARGDDRKARHYDVITRDDGRKQWAYKGKPLYTWVNDHKPGDTTGDGFLNGAWHVAKP